MIDDGRTQYLQRRNFFKSREYLNFGRDTKLEKKLRKHLLRLGDGLNTFGHDSQIFLTLKMVQH